MAGKNQIFLSVLLIGSILSGCGSSSSNDSSSAALRAASLSRCTSTAPASLATGISISGDIDGVSYQWSCTNTSATMFRQTNSIETTKQNYKFDCVSPSTTANSLNMWIIAPTIGSPLTVQMPWATTQPNLSARVTVGSKRIEQDSFSIDDTNMKNIAAVVWSMDDGAILESKVGRRMKGCMEGNFTAVSSKAGGTFTANFDVVFE